MNEFKPDAEDIAGIICLVIIILTLYGLAAAFGN